jgi:hypothetical protein
LSKANIFTPFVYKSKTQLIVWELEAFKLQMVQNKWCKCLCHYQPNHSWKNKWLSKKGHFSISGLTYLFMWWHCFQRIGRSIFKYHNQFCFNFFTAKKFKSFKWVMNNWESYSYVNYNTQ